VNVYQQLFPKEIIPQPIVQENTDGNIATEIPSAL
jgi:hypothetical protein